MLRFDRRRVIGRGRKRHRGRGLADFLGKAGSFLKDTKLISSAANMIPGIGPIVGGIAGMLGFGRRHRKIYGHGLNLAGGRRMHHGGYAKVGY